jgi:phosphatidylinositol dimannoside acyltransferase
LIKVSARFVRETPDAPEFRQNLTNRAGCRDFNFSRSADAADGKADSRWRASDRVPPVGLNIGSEVDCVTFRHLLSWKSLFYDGLIPALRALPPAQADAVLGGLGRVVAKWPARRLELVRALERVKRSAGADWNVRETLPRLEANVPRFLARDRPLDGADDAQFAARFEVQGEEHLREALAQGRGVILAGCHLGAHLSAPHWVYRQGLPLRMLIQRPRHVSKLLDARFDADGPNPQSGFFLRRHLTPDEASKRIFRTRTALREGTIVYLKADVPWAGPNTRPGRLLGYSRTFQSLWAEFAALFRAPVVPVFCTHLPGGRYALTFDPAWTVRRGEETEVVTRYLARLEAQILANPADAVAHLLWPCYGPLEDEARFLARKRRRPQPVMESTETAVAA